MSATPGPDSMTSAKDALDMLGGGLVPEAAHPLTGSPFLVIALDAGGPVDAFARLARDLPAVIVGVAEGTPRPLATSAYVEGFDLLLTPLDRPPAPWVACPDLDACLNALTAAVTAAPLAAVALVQLLRAGERLRLPDALVAESFVYSMLQSGTAFQRWLADHPPDPPPTSSGDDDLPVVVTRRGDGLAIELNRPHVHNAFDVAMREGLIEALRLVAADPSLHEIRLSGRGPSFCSGGDLREFGTAPDPVTAHAVRTSRSVAAWLAPSAERVTVDLHGACVGAGVELAALCGSVRAAPDTWMALPELEMGLIPGAGGTVSLPRRVGRHRSAFLALSGSRIDAVTAAEWGLVDHLSP